MPRAAATIPTEHLHLKLEARDRARVDLFLYSELEGRVPKGAHKKFFTELIEKFFSQEYWTLPSGEKVYGTPEAINNLRRLFEC